MRSHFKDNSSGSLTVPWRSRTFFSFSISLFALWFTATAAHPSSELKAPFQADLHRGAFGTLPSRFNCLTPSQPVRDLLFGGFYADRGEGSSVLDASAKQAYDEAVRPIARFERSISHLSDLYFGSSPPKEIIARCVLEWLIAWARSDAMLGKVSEQGGYVRKWALATVAMSYLKVRGEQALEGEKKAAVERWISRWTRIVREDYSTGLRRESRRNNHLYWAAWSVSAAAVVLNDHKSFQWGLDRYRFALEQIQEDGTLPLELKRKSKALHYHIFSIAPLILIAETGTRNGIPLYDGRGGALHRLARRSIEALDDPIFFQRATGHVQDWVGELSGDKLAWMEPYYARHPQGNLKKWIRRFRPLKNPRLGGDLTLLYGAPMGE